MSASGNVLAFLVCVGLFVIVALQDNDIRELKANVAQQQSQINRLREGYNLVSDKLWPHFAPKEPRP